MVGQGDGCGMGEGMVGLGNGCGVDEGIVGLGNGCGVDGRAREWMWGGWRGIGGRDNPRGSNKRTRGISSRS